MSILLVGKRLLVGGDFIQLWSCEEYHEQRNLLEENVFWTCIWACKYVIIIVYANIKQVIIITVIKL